MRERERQKRLLEELEGGLRQDDETKGENRKR
jgi:hypothetical protein